MTATLTKMKLEPGVITGSALQDLYVYMKEAECALPAVNVINSHGANAAMQAAKEAKAPVIIQLSHGGAHFYAGKWLPNANAAAVTGGVSAALHVHTLAQAYGVPVILHTDHASKKLLPWVEGLLTEGEKYYATHKRPLYSSHMLDLSEEPLAENLEICRRILERMNRIDMTLEIELGVTGGEEDGVDNSDIDNSRLYTQPADVLAAYDALKDVGAFTIAASFGNTHGVYKPGNVKLTPMILKNSQDEIARKRGGGPKPVNFVFHGGSGSTPNEIREAVSYGVVKMNIDTDTQWAFTQPIKAYMDEKDAYLRGQLGNPEGEDKPNKKYIDPRGWLHLGERGIATRLVQAFRDLGTVDKFEI